MNEKVKNKYRQVIREGRFVLTEVDTKYGLKYQLEYSKTNMKGEWNNQKIQYIVPKDVIRLVNLCGKLDLSDIGEKTDAEN